MTTETAGAGTPAADTNALEAQDTATAENAEATTAQQSEADEEGEAGASETTGDDQSDEAAATPEWANRRFAELTRKRREAERRAARAEARLREMEGKSLDDLDFEEQIAERTLRRNRQEQAEDARESAHELAMEAFAESEASARSRFPDYEAVTRNPNLTITPDMLSAVADEDNGPDVLYHLGKNPSLAARIAAMPVARQAKELGKIAARLAAPKTQPNPPPAPVKPVGGVKPGASKDPEKMSMAEYIAWREANP